MQRDHLTVSADVSVYSQLAALRDENAKLRAERDRWVARVRVLEERARKAARVLEGREA